MSSSDKLISELIKNIDNLKQENSTSSSTHLSKIMTLEQKITELEASTTTIAVLRSEKAEYQQRVLNLEAKITAHLSEKEESNAKMESLKAEFNKFKISISTLTNTSVVEDGTFSADSLILLVIV